VSCVYSGANNPVPVNWGKANPSRRLLTSCGVSNSHESRLVVKFITSSRGIVTHTRYYKLTTAFPLVPGMLGYRYVDDDERINSIECLIEALR
jgi:hypothetical protein